MYKYERTLFSTARRTALLTFLLAIAGLPAVASAQIDLNLPASDSGTDSSSTLFGSSCFARPDSDGVVYSSLQEALDAATNGDTVRMAGVCDQVETVNGTPQVGYIDQDLTLRGGYTETDWVISDPLANPTVIDALTNGRGLRVNGNITVRIENLTLTNGDASGLGGAQFSSDGGAAILNIDSDLTLNRVTLVDNQVLAGTSQEARGGAVASEGGDLTIRHSAIHSNVVSGSFSYGGGVMLANGTLTLDQSEVYDNTAVADNFDGSPRAEGGGVYIADNASLLISDSRLAGNSAQGPGGGIATGTNATLNLTDSEVVANDARRQGGGLYLPRATAVIDRSLIAANTVDGSPGFAYGRQGGGGLYLESSSDVTIRQTLVASNTVTTRGLGGGIAVSCWRCTNSVHVENSTLSGNTAVEGGGGFSSYLEQDFLGSTNSVVLLDHVSVINNNATSGNGHALNQERETAAAGDVGSVNASFGYQNSLIAGNGGANECRNSATHSTITQLSGGYNLFIDGAGCTNNGTTDQTVADQTTLFSTVVESALAASNTHPLISDAGNPAFDAVPEGTNGCAGGVSVDQRGAVRAGGPGFGDDGCEVGAYELFSAALDFEVTASLGNGEGSITPATQNVTLGEDASFTVTPDAGWSIDTVNGDTCNPEVVSGDQWAAVNITENCAVEANFVMNQYAIGGEVSGLEGTGLMLDLNGIESLPITADGPFTFATELDDNTAFTVTVATQPTGPIQTCTVANGAGTLAGADVTDVVVNCVSELPAISLSATALDLGNVLDGETSSDSVTVTSTGTGELIISEVVEPGAPFAVAGGSCTDLPVTLLPGESCTLEIAFTPLVESGAFADELSIVSNADSSPDTLSLAGSVGPASQPLPVPGLGAYGLLLLILLVAGIAWRSRPPV